jgi:glycine oxidase
VSTTRTSAAVFQPDVIVVGGGLIGLTCATALARQDLRVLLISSNEPGSASPASAGILAPSVGHSPRPARTLGLRARDMYPGYVQSLTSRTGIEVPLDRSGVIEIAFNDEEASALRSDASEHSEWIDARALHDLEPALAPVAGAMLYRGDGVVDSAALLNAVGADAARDGRIRSRDGRVTRLKAGRASILVELASGDRLEAPAVVLAAGAWVSLIVGLPRALPVVPVRGQLLALAGAHLRHVVISSHGYVVSRGNRTLVGSTMESVGFDAQPTRDGAALLRAYAREISPELAAYPTSEHWAGLRPVTPDLLPIIGPDPACAGLFYACGHSRNGVLLAPLTASAIAELVACGSTSIDVGACAPSRFGA